MRRRGFGSVLISLGAALALIVGNESAIGRHLWTRLLAALTRHTYEVSHSWPVYVAWRAVSEFFGAVHNLFPGLLSVACFAAIGGVLARALASARVREGRPDPLEWLRSRKRLQRWVRNTPAVVLSLPWLLWTLSTMGELTSSGSTVAGWLSEDLANLFASAGIVGLTYLATRGGMRALLAPVVNDPEPPRDAGDIVFSAVAVTARTRTVVGSFAAATVAMVGLALTAPSDPRFGWALAAYVLTALSAPLFFQRAARIAVGIDGVWVRDASRTRFFAYRDLEEARPRGADLELVAGGRAVLRLQMHGDDAGRRDEVLARVNEAIARSRESSSRGAQMLVQALPAHHLASSAKGGEGYRVPSVSRDQLWEVVEGQASDAAARTAAAEVLAVQLDRRDRERLRVAAGQCAEPRLRVTLEAIAGDADGEIIEQEQDRRPRPLPAVVHPDDRG